MAKRRVSVFVQYFLFPFAFEASLVERTAFAERISAAQEKGEAISIDIAQDPHNLEMFMRYAEQYGGDSAAAHNLMESELARPSLRPNRVFSDGTALPASFGDIRDQHGHQRGDGALTPDIAGLHQSNREQTSRFGNAKPSQETAPMVSPVREEVRTTGNRIRSDAESSRTSFDAKTEIIKTDDGALASMKSLLVQSGKQVGKDAGATLDNAKDVVNFGPGSERLKPFMKNTDMHYFMLEVAEVENKF